MHLLPTSIIRPARAQESAALGAVAYAAKAFWGYSAAQLEAWREGLTPSPASIDAGWTFVAEVDGRIAGFYQVHADARPPELEHLWVHPQFMRRGLGRALLRHAIEALRRHGAHELAIDSDPNAEPFYRACGAVRVAEIPAPTEAEPQRIRPQLRLALTPASAG
ncbi:GNAT family N-acetyltransferase [Pelomonas sp. CA6]|uniref:GNAT family N-acetyltransferase n=1 Tax=Pelomonas sp. CA6 TaxID=2907999 RepID=UPI001F4B1507|nr:GNAT family N-acetyltransferase [Pelomonas sp. CA6]MCH7342561.1 GNAT family N-acetyltransferase [Pelomonas sp. CA6]